MKKYRIRYSKGEEVKFIGHLDMLKVFSRAAIRADIPISYSEGFNPHPDFVFGMPLAVGVTSEAEYVDTTLSEDWKAEEVMTRFNNVLPKGIKIIECREIGEKTQNIMRSVKACVYMLEIVLSPGNGNQTDGGQAEGNQTEGGQSEKTQSELFEILREKFDEKSDIFVIKHSKSGPKELNITPLFFDIKLEKDMGDYCVVCLETSAGNEATLRPELAMEGLSKASNVECEINKIHRIALI